MRIVLGSSNERNTFNKKLIFKAGLKTLFIYLSLLDSHGIELVNFAESFRVSIFIFHPHMR